MDLACAIRVSPERDHLFYLSHTVPAPESIPYCCWNAHKNNKENDEDQEEQSPIHLVFQRHLTREAQKFPSRPSD